MSPVYSVRKARPADLDTLVAFALREAREAEGHAAEAAAVRRGISAAFDAPPLATYWVAESDGRIAASVSAVKEWSNLRGGDYWWVQSVFILPEHRGTGLIRTLLDHVAAAAREAGALDLRLYAHGSNERALAAYRRYGFAPSPYVMMRLDLRGAGEG